MSQNHDSSRDRGGPFRTTGADKAAFVERLRIILSHWPSADRLAREMKVSPSAFRKWLKGEAEPSRERLVALAHAAGVGIAWLAEGAGSTPAFETNNGAMRRSSNEANGQSDWNRFVLMHKPQAAADGLPAGADGSDAFIALRDDWIRSICQAEPKQLAMEAVTDEAMLPTIRRGATLLINISDQAIQALGIYVVDLNGERMVRRVQRKSDGSLVLLGDHPAWQPDLVSAARAADVAIIGRVVWFGSVI